MLLKQLHYCDSYNRELTESSRNMSKQARCLKFILLCILRVEMPNIETRNLGVWFKPESLLRIPVPFLQLHYVIASLLLSDA
jgi:hypothetical protein